jgi:hypothetical protein
MDPYKFVYAASISVTANNEFNNMDPSKYPQGFFKDKYCGFCSTNFVPRSPSNRYCSIICKQAGNTSNFLKRSYGITIQDYATMFKEQNGVCKICGEDGESCKKGDAKIALVVDHCHNSKKVKGLLCVNCNLMLGYAKDSTKRLESAKDYLERATTIPEGSTLK